VYNKLIVSALQSVYPEHEWKPYKPFTNEHIPLEQAGASKAQMLMFEMVKKLLPDTPILSSFKIPLTPDNTSDKLRSYKFDVSSLNEPTLIAHLYSRYFFQIFLLHWNTKEKLISSPLTPLENHQTVKEQIKSN
jgi:hypothetical protein